MKKLIKQTLTVGTCALVASAAHANPTSWEQHATPALTEIRQRVAGQPAGNQVLVMPEFPDYNAATGGYSPVNATYLTPTAVSTEYNIAELNGAASYCDQWSELTKTTNDASVNITKVFTLGLDVVTKLSKAVLDADAFNSELQNDPLQPISVASNTEAKINGLKRRIEDNQALVQTLTTRIEGRDNASYAKLKLDYNALLTESQTGVPTAAGPLQAELSSLKSQASSLLTTINTLRGADPNSPAIPILQAQLDSVNAQVAAKQAELDALVGPYRSQKADEAAAFKTTKLDPYEAQTAELQAQLDAANDQVITDQQAISDARVDPAYIDARGKLDRLSLMLQEADNLLTQFRGIRDAATKDALFAINYGRTTLNDWSAIDAGVGVGDFPIWTQDIVKIPNAVSYGGYTATLATLYDLNVRSKVTDILNEPVAQLPMYNVDPQSGSITPMPQLNLPPISGQGQKARDMIEIFNPADVAPDFFPLLSVTARFNGVAASLRIPRKKLTSETPTVRLHMSLATYCGKLTATQEESAAIPLTVGNQKLVVRPSRVVLNVEKRALSQGNGHAFFEDTLVGTYNLEEQIKPARATCSLNIDDYESYTRSWGKVEHNYIFWSDSHSWDDTAIDTESNHTLRCHFEQTSSDMSPEQKKEIDGINQQAINEVLAQFIQTNAKQPITPSRFAPETVQAYADKFPRHTWSPTMTLLCGGEPICNIVGLVLDNVGTTVQSSSTSVTRKGSVNMSVDTTNVYARMVPHIFSTGVRFNVTR